MAALVHPSLTNCQGLHYAARFAAPARPGLFAGLTATLRLWHRRSRERQELARLSQRELRDMRVSSADVWHEIRQPFWRSSLRR
ncbi:MAG: DUF1127 domain-containing protein [Acetobacteraceae bacterium]|jgi:uncharacterized protein YjiS (DUF1127 family)